MARNIFFKARESISIRVLILLLHVVAFYLSLVADFFFLKDAPKQ